MEKEEAIIKILEKLPKDILIKCAEQLIKFSPNPLELELESLTKQLTDPNLEDIEFVISRIREIKELLKTGTISTVSTETSGTDCISRSKIPLRDYQIKAIRFINNPAQDSLLVVHGTGTGKTLTALTASQCYLDANPNDRVIVISPASITGNFEKEMEKYGGRLSENYKFYSFTKFANLNKGAYKTPLDVYVDENEEKYRDDNPDDTPEELMFKMTKHFNEEIRSKVESSAFVFDKPNENKTKYSYYKKKALEINLKNNFYDCRNSMIIIDEAHNLRNMTERYLATFRCIIQCKKLLLLTATPYVNHLKDFVPIINLLYRDDKILKKGSRCKIPTKISNENTYFAGLKTIHEYLKGKVTFINDKTSEFFPTVEYHKREITMTTDFFNKYEKALIIDRDFGDDPNVFYNGFRRAVNAIGIEEYLNEKIDIIIEIINNGKQTLIFTNWVEAGVNVLKQTFEENDIEYLVISGEILPNTRLDIVKKFNSKKVQVLIITLAGSEGLDLKEVGNVIILDPVWNPSVMEQIVGRAVRFKSHANLPINQRKVDVFNLILKTPDGADVPSGDEILYQIIYNKQKQMDDVNRVLKNASI